MTATITIRSLLDSVLKGQIRIPAFQRGFVWDPDMVAYFMDSICKGYPFGSFLLWRTKHQLKVERDLGPFSLPALDPDYPIDYVLDGQQRITSIFGVFQTQIQIASSANWAEVYLDYRASHSAQESQFLSLPAAQVDQDRHFPLRTFFESVAYRAATEKITDKDILKRIDDVQSIFKEAQLPFQTIKTEDKKIVAIVFERINRRQVALDTLQLLSAWTWSEDFDLRTKFEGLTEELEPFGFKAVGEDTNLLLRCAAAILGEDAAPESLLNMQGHVVRNEFSKIVNGIKGAIDFLKQNLSVASLKNLPFPTLIVPLSVFFAESGNAGTKISDAQRKTLVSWFWRASFSRRYASGVLRNLKADIDEVKALKSGQPSKLGGFQTNIDASHFLDNTFTVDTVNTRTLIMLLAQAKPLSLVSGSPITLSDVLRESNRSEFHHLYPRSHLKTIKVSSERINSLANFAFISAIDNKALGGVAPSKYRSKMPPDSAAILSAAYVDEALLISDNFDQFITARAAKLAEIAAQLIA
jgi:hypothetical protein